METTLDLADDLVRAIEFRAFQDGRRLNDAVADLLRKGLAASIAPRPLAVPKGSARVTTDPATGLPVILGDSNAPGCQMTNEEMLALYQETQLREDLERVIHRKPAARA